MTRREDERIKAWLDGELPEATAARVERRVQSSPELRARADDYRRLSQAIRTAEESAVPPLPDLDRLRRSGESARRSEDALVSLLRRGAAVAAAVLVTATALSVVSLTSSSNGAVAAPDRGPAPEGVAEGSIADFLNDQETLAARRARDPWSTR